MLVEGVPAKHPRRTLTLVCIFKILLIDSYTIIVDCQDATELGEQTFVCQRGIHDDAEPFRGEQ